ncbi:hypothetical protein KNT81_gp054 [Proteus phage phiP4-3]|uniref:Uncharacterized protein n=1 Tax=Proteus phage phiP4-3 TaxID=2065203 RepID=A0A2I6PFA3_9CAUD|nr:hypothetical protein KNT81_gp054 [Proteus phage phiP4-3]AUM58412.1 hypothetical protein phiP43_054 [Proteus phage phiP4-3]
MSIKVVKELNHASPENLDEFLRLYIEQWHKNHLFELRGCKLQLDLTSTIYTLIQLMDPEHALKYNVKAEFNYGHHAYNVQVQTPSKTLKYTGSF